MAFFECWRKPEAERMFYHKDALKQHIALAHCKNKETRPKPVLPESIDLDSWMVELDTEDYGLMCHLCHHENESWAKRAKHIIAHFDSGYTMEMWTRDERSTVCQAAGIWEGIIT